METGADQTEPRHASEIDANVFDAEPHLGAIVSVPAHEGSEPARAVWHDNEGDWIVSCATVDSEDIDSWVTLHVHHLLERDPTIHPLGTLPTGWAAYRGGLKDSWDLEPITNTPQAPSPPAQQCTSKTKTRPADENQTEAI